MRNASGRGARFGIHKVTASLRLDGVAAAVLAEDNKDDEPRPLGAARDMYAACMDTSRWMS